MSITSGCSWGFQPSSNSVSPLRRASVRRSMAARPVGVSARSRSVPRWISDTMPAATKPCTAGRMISASTLSRLATSRTVHAGRSANRYSNQQDSGGQVDAGPVRQRLVQLGPVLPIGHSFESQLDLLNRRPRPLHPEALAHVDGLHGLAQRQLGQEPAQNKGQEGDRHRDEEDGLHGFRDAVDHLVVDRREQVLQLVQRLRIQSLQIDLLRHAAGKDAMTGLNLEANTLA